MVASPEAHDRSFSELQRGDCQDGRRLRALVEGSFALARVIADATSFEEAAPALLEAVGTATGWDAVGLWSVDPAAERLAWVGGHALSRAADALAAIHTEASLRCGEGLAGRVWGSGAPVLVEDLSRIAWFARGESARRTFRSAVGFPVRASGALVGVLELFSREPRAGDRALLEGLAGLASPIGHVLERRRARDMERMLDEASTVLFGSLDSSANLEALAALAIPRLADVCVIYGLADDGFAEQVAAAHVDPARSADMRGRGGSFRLHPDTVVGRVSRSGRAELFERADEPIATTSALELAHAAFLRSLGLGSVMFVPLRVRDRALGAIAFATVGSRRYRNADVAVGEELARRASIAIDNARLFESERAARAAAEQARSEAESATRAKDEFLAVLSHELRTPLQSMLGWVQMLGTRKLDAATTARGHAAIERATRTQMRLIEDLLDISRIVAGKLCLDVRRLDLVPVVDAAVDAVRAAAEAKGIEIVRELRVARAEVSGDPARLQQVIVNLLSNALKFTERGGHVTVRLVQDAGAARLAVEDDGRGISPEFLPHIFERFRQADSTKRRAHGGLGLGLTIVRHLVELHGGAVSAASDGERRGARFEVILPLVTSRGPEVVADAAERRSLPRLDARHVLVVEDDADTRELVCTVLAECGAAVTSVGSASEALAALASSAPDLVLSDIGMPDEDGYSFVRRLRELGAERGRYIPAIALTAYATLAAREQALAAGFDAHLAKPVQPADLARAAVQLLADPTAT